MGDILAHAAEPYATEDGESASQARRAQDGRIALDIAAGLQPAHPLENGRRGEVDLQGEVLDGDAGVLLQDAQDGDVGFVQGFGHGGFFC